MTLTRGTPRFAELAADVEERLDQLGIVVDPKGVEEDLRVRIRRMGEQFGVTEATALGYATADLADEGARSIVVTVKALVSDLGAERQPVAGQRGHLRLVR